MKKTCSRCNLSKSDEDFGYRNRAKGQQLTVCKSCTSKYQRDHYQSNKAAYIAKARKWSDQTREVNRELLREYFITHPCVDCGEADFEVLELDHRDGTLKEFAVASRLDRAWAAIRAEIDKCDVRCANCHKRRTNRQFGYWRYMPL